MPDLSFQVTGVTAIPFAAAPTLAFHLEVANKTPRESIHSVALRCQFSWKSPGGNTRPGKKQACAIFSESRRVGAKPFGRSSGHISAR